MNGGLQIEGFGFTELREKLDEMGEAIREEAGKLIFDGAHRIANLAKDNAPVDYGFLKNLIVAERVGELGAKVESLANYSAYLEFGTGTKVDVPAELADYAIQFKGTHDVVGINPHPFFFSSLDAIAPSIVADVEAMLQEEANR